ncbi:MAG: AraC family transcriptional regulator [Kiritimatiellae bacterium]|nr:AraC family transcriptional regulator [Kiritimatiellia bacterium]
MADPRRDAVKGTYTYDFPEDARHGAVSGNPLEGVAFIFYVHAWTRRVRDWNYAGVLSPYWRLLHCSDGAGRVRFGATEHLLNRRNLILIPPDVPTDMSASGVIDMLYAHFLPIFPISVELIFKADRPIELKLRSEHRHLIRLLMAGYARAGQQHTANLLRFRALLDVCFAELLEPYVARLCAAKPPDARAVRMLDCIQRRYAAKLTNRQIAAAAGLGADRAVRLFEDATGMTPMARLRRVRLAAAARLLVTTDKSIKEVAVECGFANRFHFTRLFADRTGVGPAAFRRRFGAAAHGRPAIDLRQGS